MYSSSKINTLQAITKITIFLPLTGLLQLSSTHNKLSLEDEKSINRFSKECKAETETKKTLAELIEYLTIAHMNHFRHGKDVFIERWKSAIFSKMNDAIEAKKRISPRADLNYYKRLALNILKEHLNEWETRKRKLKEKEKVLNAHSRRSPSE